MVIEIITWSLFCPDNIGSLLIVTSNWLKLITDWIIKSAKVIVVKLADRLLCARKRNREFPILLHRKLSKNRPNSKIYISIPSEPIARPAHVQGRGVQAAYSKNVSIVLP
jgi:hypothetical protein